MEVRIHNSRMNKFLLFIIFVLNGMFLTSQVKAAESTNSKSPDLTQAEYSTESIECTVMEVAIQYKSGDHETKFDCIEQDSTNDNIYALEGLPSNFKEQYQGKLTSAKTVQGQSVKITVKGKNVKVDGANVTAVNVETSNGVIHIIDTVILPN